MYRDRARPLIGDDEHRNAAVRAVDHLGLRAVHGTCRRDAYPDHDGGDGDYRLDEQVSHLLRRAHQRSTALFQAEVGGDGPTPAQFSALVKLQEQGEVSQNALGRMVAMDAATMQGVVRRLCDRGLVVRRPDPGDRRRVLLSLTAAGRACVEMTTPAARDAARAALAPLSARERQTLVKLLRRIG